MLYKITLQVESETICKENYQLEVDGFILEFLVDKEEILKGLTITVKVEGYKEYLPEIILDIDSQMIKPIPRDRELYTLLVGLSQHIEAFGSFWFGIKKIYWESPIRSWIAETEEEYEALCFIPNDYREEDKEIQCYREMSLEMLKSLIQNRQRYQTLILPMSFYREAYNDLRSDRNTKAFINFYFYLDDLFGQGKTRNKEVEKSFKSSSLFREAVHQTIQILQGGANPEDLAQIEKFLAMEKCEFSVNGIIELIVKVRGNLSHFSQRSTKQKGHPLNQQDFRGMAFLLHSICVHTFMKLTTSET